MKNISAMYGGSIETNDYDLFKFATKNWSLQTILLLNF